MFAWLERKRQSRRIGRQLYESIVAHARAPVFYRELGVADNMEGRFEVIVVHVVLALRRLKRAGSVGQPVGQALLEHFIADMDDALRQIGIGDMGVPRRVQRAAAAVQERARDYGAGLDAASHNDKLVNALLEHVYGRRDGPASQPREVLAPVERLATYVLQSAAALDALSDSALFSADLKFAAVEIVQS